MKRSLTLLTLLALGAGSVHADVSRVTRQATPQAPAAPALQAARDWVEPSPVVPKAHTRRTDWETVVVGTTRYDYQHNGSTSRMLAVSSDGIVHGSFMGGVDAGNGRRVQAWCVDPTDLSLTGPTDVLSQRTGYTTSAVTGPNPVNALPANSGVVGMHSSTPPVSWLAVDFAGCTLAFNLMQHSGDDYIWPHISVDGMDRVHMVGYGADDSDAPSTIFYDATTNGTSWDNGSFLVVSDNTESLGAVAVANNHSQRAAVVYLEKTGPEDVPYDGPPEGGEIGRQIHHDVKAYLADDGNVSAQIMAENSMNLTDYGPGSESPFGPYGCRGYSDVDGLFDMSNEENLHVVFSTAVMFTDTLTVHDGDGDTSELVYYNWNLGRGQIWHMNVDTGEWSHVAGYNSGITEEDLFYSRPQAWRMWRDRPSIAVDPSTGWLYTIWSEYTSADTSAAGFYNGEIMARCSADNGLSWGPAVNLTVTPSPGCTSGDCDAEDWPSLAAVADGGFLHLTYVHDLDAGGIPNTPPEGAETLNDVMYMKVPVSAIPPHTGTPWNAAGHVGLVTDSRWYSWTCDSWTGDTAFLDSTHWVEPVHVFNESPFDVRVDNIAFYHHPSDLLGTPEDGGLMELDLEVFANGEWMSAMDWDGWLPQWRGTKFRAHVSYSGLPNYDQLLVFHFADREDLVYRISYESSDMAGCPEVGMLDRTQLASYSGIVLTNVAVEGSSQPAGFALAQNWPNPFNPLTRIGFSLPRSSDVRLNVYNLLGESVATLVNGQLDAGSHSVDFDASGLASGVYIYTLEANGQAESRKMVLLK